tara:strand:+ start:117 stop:602 length:486 start_codon:yes stop_codon:yes gene_type:complete
MKKVFFLLSSLFLLNGCAETVALLGPVGGASNGKMLQSSLNSVISYGVKHQTGKSPLEHALAYAEEKNPEKKQETCISFIERTRSEFCTILNKQISLTNIAIKEKTLEIVKKYPKNNKTSENIVLEEENFMSSFLPKTSPRKLAIAVQAKMKEKSKNKDLN